mgnify:CR=1 FL=1
MSLNCYHRSMYFSISLNFEMFCWDWSFPRFKIQSILYFYRYLTIAQLIKYKCVLLLIYWTKHSSARLILPYIGIMMQFLFYESWHFLHTWWWHFLRICFQLCFKWQTTHMKKCFYTKTCCIIWECYLFIWNTSKNYDHGYMTSTKYKKIGRIQQSVIAINGNNIKLNLFHRINDFMHIWITLHFWSLIPHFTHFAKGLNSSHVQLLNIQVCNFLTPCIYYF